MLAFFSVEHFKMFRERVEIRFDEPGNYEFSDDVVSNGIVEKAILFGYNGAGKSTLGYAIMDIVNHLTDNSKDISKVLPYLNLDDGSEVPASFEYRFDFDGTIVEYKYKKKDPFTLVVEELSVDGNRVLYYDYSKNEGAVELMGTETLDLNKAESNLSRVKYVKSNALLPKNRVNDAFTRFIDYVDRMLMFWSYDGNSFLGFMGGIESISSAIIKEKKVEEFERFLKENGIDMELDVQEFNGNPQLVIKYEKGFADFFSVASTGTKAMALFFYWYMRMNKASFVYMDEFDAFYHYELAENVVDLVRKIHGPQVVFTTHNTDLISNDIMRPDCYYLIKGCRVTSFNKLTNKELRRAHNIQKLFKAGAFDE